MAEERQPLPTVPHYDQVAFHGDTWFPTLPIQCAVLRCPHPAETTLANRTEKKRIINLLSTEQRMIVLLKWLLEMVEANNNTC